jgi:hypothetical protein
MAWFRRRGTFVSRPAYVVIGFEINCDVKIHEVRTQDVKNNDVKNRDVKNHDNW